MISIIENNTEAGAYWVSSVDEWKRPTEIVEMYNKMNEAYAELCIKYATAMEHNEGLINDYNDLLSVNKALTLRNNHYSKRIRVLNDIIDKANGILKGGA